MMQHYQREFLEFAIAQDVLRFGEFKLKSGRQSPYFFNAGLFNSGGSLAQLGRFYAQAIIASGVQFDMLFGPAYKGISLAASCAIALADHHDRDVPFAFNRKEAKDHGEGGVLVGAPLKGRVLVIDDVISAGTSVRESADLIATFGASFAGVAIAVDRQERGATQTTSAVTEIQRRYNIPVVSIVNFNHLIEWLTTKGDTSPMLMASIHTYREAYGAVE